MVSLLLVWLLLNPNVMIHEPPHDQIVVSEPSSARAPYIKSLPNKVFRRRVLLKPSNGGASRYGWKNFHLKGRITRRNRWTHTLKVIKVHKNGVELCINNYFNFWKLTSEFEQVLNMILEIVVEYKDSKVKQK